MTRNRREKPLFDKAISAIYDRWILSGYYDYEKEIKEIQQIIGKKKSLLELGIGTGNTAILLAKKGYDVEGIDDSPHMLAILRKKLQKERVKIHFWRQDIRKLKTEKNYGVVLSAGGAFVYMQINRRLHFDSCFRRISEIKDVFRRVFAHLNPGGIFLINIQYHGKHFKLSLPDGTKYWFDLVQKSPKHLIKTHNWEKHGKVYLRRRFDFYRWTTKEIDDLARELGFVVHGLSQKKGFYILEKPVHIHAGKYSR